MPEPAATPAAPAAPAASAAPAPAVGMFDHAAFEEPKPVAQPEMDAPLGLPGQSPEPEKPSEPAAPVEGEPAPEPEKPAGETPAAATAPEPKLLAVFPEIGSRGFKSVEDLEIAYKRSSQEGQRLAKEYNARESELESAQNKVRDLEAQIAAGPEITELSKEELEAMGPIEAARHFAKLAEQRILKKQSEERKASEAKQAKAAQENLVSEIKARAESMRQDKQRFPDFDELQPVMDEFIDYEPNITGHKGSPMILYYAAKGYKAVQTDAASRKAAAEAAAKAKAKADADSAAAGANGSPGAEQKPAGTVKELDPNSDEAHNQRLIRGAKPKPVFQFQ